MKRIQRRDTRATSPLAGGEIHQQAGANQPLLTTNQGVVLSDNQNTLRAGAKGPSLLEDFLLREKITHFDHERIPERVVHARGSGAHGYFECTRNCSDWTRAAFLGREGLRTPVFARLSTVAGGAGSADTPRDVRGFAVKFYTSEGNFDLVGNNVPVFFIQDAIKFPDLVHALKMEADKGYPQAASAHDAFWDFVTLMPESLHMLMWAMSDRTLPRSLRHIDGFGVHSFRFVAADGDWHFVKFHWRSELGVASTTWDEAVKIAGADPDHHRRDLWQAIEAGEAPAWTLGVQVISPQEAEALPFDVLDPTKLVPEELVPVRPIGRMVLDRNPDNFFAETEQVAFCPAHLVPGIDFSDDPLLQGRLMSYLDTQLSRLGGPNFHQLPVNRPRCPVHNFQRDGQFQQNVPFGADNYEPNSLAPLGPRESARLGFASVAVPTDGARTRLRSASLADHHSQARQFYRSQTASEQRHIAQAFAFELSKVQAARVRNRALGHLRHVDADLAQAVATRLGQAVPEADALAPRLPLQPLPEAPSLSAQRTRAPGLRGAGVAALVADGAPPETLRALQQTLKARGARFTLVAADKGGPTLAGEDAPTAPHAILAAAPSCLFDAVVVLGSPQTLMHWVTWPAAQDWLRDAWRHLKPIGLDPGGRVLARAAGLPGDEAVIDLEAPEGLEAFCACVALGKHLAREGAPGTDV